MKSMKQPKKTKTPLDAALDSYKGRYGVSNQFFLDLLGRDGKSLYKDSYIAKRKGKLEFTFREAKTLADTLGMTLDDFAELLPDINR